MATKTALLIEPRRLERLPSIIQHFQRVLPDWQFVFYCGKSAKWSAAELPGVEIRELPTDNFTSEEYSNFCKSPDLWKSLGPYVLVFQSDTWIMNTEPYTIDFFLKRNKSFTGGNMYYHWEEMKAANIFPTYRNFNGGLSLRKRDDMLKILYAFPPRPTNNSSAAHEEMAEDVYFTIGCYKLDLPVGCHEEDSHFALHTVPKDAYFGIHQPTAEVKEHVLAVFPEAAQAYI